MTNDELIATLNAAADSQANIALKMLLLLAAERINELVDK